MNQLTRTIASAAETAALVLSTRGLAPLPADERPSIIPPAPTGTASLVVDPQASKIDAPEGTHLVEVRIYGTPGKMPVYRVALRHRHDGTPALAWVALANTADLADFVQSYAVTGRKTIPAHIAPVSL